MRRVCAGEEVPAAAKGRLSAATRAVLYAVDTSRPLLCVLSTLLTLGFVVLLFLHIPRYTRPTAAPTAKAPLPEPQPMFAIPVVLALPLVFALACPLLWTFCGYVDCCVGCFSFLFAPVVAWLQADSWTYISDVCGASQTPRALPTFPTPGDMDHVPCHGECMSKPAEAVLDTVFSTLWARAAVAAAVLEAASARTLWLFTYHAAAFGNGVIVAATLALAAPEASTSLPPLARAAGTAAVVVAVLYQAVVFLPRSFSRPPPVAVLSVLCFVHDMAMVIGALSTIGTCEGSGCLSLAGYGYSYDVSWPGVAVLLSTVSILPVVSLAAATGFTVDFVAKPVSAPSSCGARVCVALVVGPIGFLLLLPVMLFFNTLSIGVAFTLGLCVPCLSIVAAVVVGLSSGPCEALEQTLLHLFCVEIGAAFSTTVAAIAPGTPVRAAPLPALCNSPLLYQGPTAAALHIVRWHAALSAPRTAALSSPHTAVELSDDDGVDRRRTCGPSTLDPVRSKALKVTLSEVAALLTPCPARATLPPTLHFLRHQPYAAVEHRSPLAVYMGGAGAAPCAVRSPSDSDPAAPCPMACHMDLETESYERALQGGWWWLLRFAWRRRSFAPLSGHELPRLFSNFLGLRDRGLKTAWIDRPARDLVFTWRFVAWGTLAIVALSRAVLFLAPFLEPAFNTNMTATGYVCLAVRLACCVGIAMISPALYRAVCRIVAFGVATKPNVFFLDAGLQRAWECMMAAYDPSPLLALRSSVPHRVVSHVVIAGCVAPFLPTDRA